MVEITTQNCRDAGTIKADEDEDVEEYDPDEDTED